MVNSIAQVSVGEPDGPRFTVVLGVNDTSPVVTSATAMVKLSPLHASHVPLPNPVQQANGECASVHAALLPPVPVEDNVKTAGSMSAPTQTEATALPQDGVCLIELSVRSP